MSRHPNLYIVGAPRCGTTALAAHLGAHPSIFFSEPKEPYYWCSDFAGMQRRTGCTTEERYRALFANASTERYRAEGSTLYLASRDAIARIVEANRDARFIVLLRDPVEIAYSFFSHIRFTMNEDVQSFEAAWNLQHPRARGDNLPNGCYEPELLQYRRIASIGTQLQRAKEIIPDGQLLTLFQEEMKRAPRKVYERILEFLEIDDDGRQEIPRVNSAAAFRSGLAGSAIQSSAGRKALGTLKRILPTALLRRLRSVKQQALTTERQREPLSEEFLAQLRKEFSEEVELVGAITGRDVSHWSM